MTRLQTPSFGHNIDFKFRSFEELQGENNPWINIPYLSWWYSTKLRWERMYLECPSLNYSLFFNGGLEREFVRRESGFWFGSYEELVVYLKLLN